MMILMFLLQLQVGVQVVKLKQLQHSESHSIGAGLQLSEPMIMQPYNAIYHFFI
jgi:hypothetical protein